MGKKLSEEEEKKRLLKKKKKKRKKKVLFIAVPILVIIAAVMVGGLLVFNNMLGQMNYVESTDKAQISTAKGINGLIPNKLDRVVNILLIGEEDMADNTNEGRSDSMILASINPKTKKLMITSLMRDMYVDIPGHGKDKLNAAYHDGGADLLVETLQNNFDITIDGYMRVDFESFQSIIDKMGGVEITLTQDEADYLNMTNYISDESNRTVTAGVNTFNGNQALGYCRVRHETASDGEDDDFGRTYRQRTVMTAIFNKYKSKNLLEMIDLADQMMSYLTTDITKQELIDYMATAAACDTSNLDTFRIPVSNGYTPKKVKIGSSYLSVLVIDEDKNAQALSDFINGTTDSEDSSDDSSSSNK